MQDHSKTDPYFPENLDDYAPWVAEHGLRAPYGECQCGCGEDAPTSNRKRTSRGYAENHPIRFINKHQGVKPRQSTKGIVTPPGTRAIALTLGQFTIVDECDFEWVSQRRWFALKRLDGYTHYAICNARRSDSEREMLLLHRLILGAPSGMDVDHIDGDGLNNTRANLRLATRGQNSFNSRPTFSNATGYKGVSWHQQRKKWRARIMFNRKEKHLGLFDSIEDAADAYNKAARELFGEFARGNEADWRLESEAG